MKTKTKQTGEKPGVTPPPDEEQQKHSIPSAVRGERPTPDAQAEAAPPPPETEEKPSTPVPPVPPPEATTTEEPKPEAEVQPSTPPAPEGQQKAPEPAPGGEATPATLEGQEQAPPASTNEQESSIKLILDKQSLGTRIKEALAGVDRITRVKLCEQLDVPIGEFKAAVTKLIEEEKVVKEDALANPPLLYLALTQEEAQQHKEKLAVAKKHDRYEALAWIHDRRTYRDAYRSWEAFLHYEMDWSPTDWEREKRHARIQMLLAERGVKLRIPTKPALTDQLNRVRDDHEMFVAVVKEFQALPENKQIAKRLKEIVDKHLDRKSKLKTLRQVVSDATEAESAMLSCLDGQRLWGMDIEKQFQQSPTRERLLELTAKHRILPNVPSLFSIARGADLQSLITKLTGMFKGWQAEREREEKRKQWLAQGESLGYIANGKLKDKPTDILQFPGQAGTTMPTPEPAPEPDEEESQAEEPDPEEAKAKYEYEIELTGDLMGLIEDTRLLTADELPLAVADLARSMVGHPITKDSGLAIKVRKK